MAKLADAPASETGGETHTSSSLVFGTKKKVENKFGQSKECTYLCIINQ